MSDKMRGRAWKFGDGVLNDGGIMDFEMVRKGVFDPEVLGRHCLAAVSPDFAKNAVPGDIIVAGCDFGRGQLHDQGPLSIKARGVGLIAESVTRAFFRLAISSGLVMIPFAPEIKSRVNDGDRLDVDFRSGRIQNLTTGETIRAQPMAEFLWEFIDAGGEKNWLQQHYSAQARR